MSTTTLATPCVVGSGWRTPKGYLIVDRGRLGRIFAHRLAWEECFGSIPPDMQVCHRCDNPPCVNPDHLFLGTNADNVADRVAKGRTRKGEGHPNTRLTDADVAEVKARLARGESVRVVASVYGVSSSTVSDIKRGVSWRHIPPARLAYDDALDRLVEIAALTDGWDSYGAPPIGPRVIERARTILAAFHSTNTPIPFVVPNSRGGITFEWADDGSMSVDPR